MTGRSQRKGDLLQGTLDMLVLQTLRWGPAHGYSISQAIRAASLVVLSTPSLLTSLVLLVIAARTGWFPVGNMRSAGPSSTGDLLWHLVVPATALALPVAAMFERLQAQAMSDVVGKPYVLAALALVRPNFVVFPLAFAGLDALRLRRLRAVLAPLWPTAVVLAVWSAVALASGADPARPLRWFVPMHTFGTVYEAGLWMRLPDGPERRLLADQKARGHNAYQAAEALEAFAGPGSKATVAQAAIRADPLGYAAARAALLPLEFRRGSWAEAELFQYVHPDAALLHVLSRFHSRYRGLFYGSFPLFLVLLGMFAANGFGWPVARAAGREVIVPFVAVLFVSVGLSSLGTYGVGRLAIAFHPFDALCWACASGALAHRLVTGRGAEAPPSHAPSSHTRPTTSLKV